MLLFPAIDMFDHKAVRLFKGDYQQMTVYSKDPLSVAKRFEDSGAKWVHLVDLQGAKDGTTPHADLVAGITKETGLQVEIGGGIRSEETILRYLDCGVSRVILGTAALGDPDFLQRVVAKYGSSIAVGVDSRDGMVATHGWTQTSTVPAEEFCRSLDEIGVSTIIATDISKDGAMQGPNLDLYRQLKKSFSGNITASGGVSSLKDLTALNELDLYGAILGKAYYTGAVDLEEAVKKVQLSITHD